MRSLLCLTLLSLPVIANAAVVYSQPHDSSGTLYQSAGNGMDYDRYVWDNFTLGSSQTITEVRWRGGYIYGTSYPCGPVLDFSIGIWGSIAGDSQPDIGGGPLYYEETIGGAAGETPVGTFGGMPMNDYDYVLATPFHATAGAKYWIMIGAFQAGVPDWGFAHGSGGDGHYFGSFINYAGGTSYAIFSGDAAFTLLTPGSVRAGDLNCDGAVNAFDIDPFVLALTDPAGYAAAYPNCDITAADINGDGQVNAFDIDPFVACLTAGGCP